MKYVYVTPLLLLTILACRDVRSPERAVPATFSSNLPIIVIDTEGAEILDEPKVPARIRIYQQQNGRTRPHRGHLVLESLIGIEVRGHSSREFFPKKQYGFEFRRGRRSQIAVPLLGMPKESDWILYGPYSDKSLLRNQLTFFLADQMGHYASRGRFVELFLLEGATTPPLEAYRGIYIVLEKIKVGRQRVDIAKTQGDSGEQTGYILKMDRLDPLNEEYAFTTTRGTHLISVYPRTEDLSEAHKDYIQQYIDDFETALAQIQSGGQARSYEDYIDVDSFIDFMIIGELSKSVDLFRMSTFMHMDINGILKMGPLWDFNQAYGNSAYHPRSVRIDGWRFGLPGEHSWCERLVKAPRFAEALVARWRELRLSLFSDDTILDFLDSRAALVEEAQQRNFSRWPILERRILGNPASFPKTYQGEVEQLKDWVLKRARWIDAHIEELR